MAIVSYRFNDTCTKRCTDKHPCTLRKGGKHDLCICDEPRCRCHTESRYLEAKNARERENELSDE